MHTVFWLENLSVRDHSDDLGVDGRILLGTLDGKMWAGCIWLRIGTSGGIL
jgi:hypothetical protein